LYSTVPYLVLTLDFTVLYCIGFVVQSSIFVPYSALTVTSVFCTVLVLHSFYSARQIGVKTTWYMVLVPVQYLQYRTATVQSISAVA